ncbi:MAG TPA: RHS repeat-associated core domain-containing protein, partial [Nitrosospira sp.]
ELRDGTTQAVLERYEYDTGAGTNLGGRLARVSGDFGSAEYGYTPEGLASSIARRVEGMPGTFVTRFEYNAQRKVTRVTYPDDSSVAYHFAPTGMLQSIPGYIDAIDYGPTGLRERIAFASGLETRRRYTPGDYLIKELVTEQMGSGQRYQHLVYDLDSVGQVKQMDDLSTVPGKVRLNQVYAYDNRNRLTHASGNVAGFDFTYEYDALGNLLRNGEIDTRFEYRNALGDTNAPNRLVRRLTSAGPEYDYDSSGNLTRDPEMGTLRYDSRHRLIRVDRPDGSVVEYTYDHNDRRILSRTTANGTTHTRVEIEGLYLIDDGVASRVVFDEDRRLAIVPASGDPLIHHFDRLGNVNVVSNGRTGAFAGHDEYTPYGRLFISMVIQPAFTFQGGRFSDGLELVLLGARHYRPSLGRFLTCDPYLLINQDKIPPLLAAANLYVYAYCNPVNFTDPTGEIAPILIAIIVAAIVGAIIGAIGAGVNGARTWDEWLLWIVGGAIGAVLTVLFWYGILIWAGVAAGTAALAAAIITLGASVLGLFTP